MRSLCNICLLALLLTACADKFGITGSTPLPPDHVLSNKKIEAGQDLLFSCLDQFNRTRIVIDAKWIAHSGNWVASIIETNQFGYVISNSQGLTAAMDANQDLNVQAGSLVILLSQDNPASANYKDGTRSLTCTFQ